MVTRVTQQLMRNNALANIFRISEKIMKAQNEISSGKRISRPSDDPAGIRDTLGLRTSIKQKEQFVRNIDFNRLFGSSSDSALDAIGIRLIRARELNLAQLNGTMTAQTRSFSKEEVDKILSGVLEEANTFVKNQHVFAGTNTRVSPFRVTGSEAEYLGNTDTLDVEISRGILLPINIPGSEVLATDLNPLVTTTTLLSDLKGGAGIPAGSFSITDRGGNNATITVAAGGTLNDVINSINSAGINVTATLNPSQTGLQINDSSPVVTQPLTVTNLGGGTTASSLGIAGIRDGSFIGEDLDPVVTTATTIADLNGGTGLTLSDVNIVNGAASGTVSLSSATTVGDVLSLINASSFNVTASINSQGNALRVVSNDPLTVAVVTDDITSTTAADLGIGGGRNVLTTLINLRDAMGKNDTSAMNALLINLEAGLTTVNDGRAKMGGIVRRMDTTNFFHEEDVVDLIAQISNVEDTDLVKSISDLAQLEIALQATLSTTARIIQPSLLNFLS